MTSLDTKAQCSRQSIVRCRKEDGMQELGKRLAIAYVGLLAMKGKVPADQEYVALACAKIANFLTTQKPSTPTSLLIIGPVGSGKTTMLSAILSVNRVIRKLPQERTPEEAWAEDFKTGSCCLTTCKAYLERAREGVDIYDIMAASDIMMFDDLGAEEPSVNVFGTIVRPMENAIKRASDAGKKVIITTNHDLDGIRNRYDSERMKDCLAGYATLDMKHMSFRQL